MLCDYITLPSPRCHRDSSWISQDTWQLIDACAALVWQHRFHSHVVDDEPIAKRTHLHSSASPHSSLMGCCSRNCIKLLTSINH